jgi:hypothetical protein
MYSFFALSFGHFDGLWYFTNNVAMNIFVSWCTRPRLSLTHTNGRLYQGCILRENQGIPETLITILRVPRVLSSGNAKSWQDCEAAGTLSYFW